MFKELVCNRQIIINLLYGKYEFMSCECKTKQKWKILIKKKKNALIILK